MSPHTQTILELRNVRVSVSDREIVRGVDLTIRAGEVHALMGPNGSGKSTLVGGLMGHPALTLSGEALLCGEPLVGKEPEERAKAGLFLAFQNPVAVPGVTLSSFLKAALRATNDEQLTARGIKSRMNKERAPLGVPEGFLTRYVNDGFSGGEKKRLEMLQLAVLRPKLALVDEIDSGLDIDALRDVAEALRRSAEGGTAVLLVTHYQRILDHVRPDYVHIFKDGRIESTGGMERVRELEAHGYGPSEQRAQVAT